MNNLFIQVDLLSASVVFYMLGMIFVLRINGFNLFSLNIIFIFFSLLFIGGRFLSCFLDWTIMGESTRTIQELFNQQRMIVTNFGVNESMYMFNYVIVWFLAFFLGSVISWKRYYLISSYKTSVSMKRVTYIKYIFLVSFLILLLIKFSEMYNVYKNGYLSLYKESYGDVLKGSIMFVLTTIIISSFAFLGIYKLATKRSKYIYTIGLIDIIIGQRGEFISKLIGGFSVSSRADKLDFKRIIIYILFMFILLNLVMFFSFRENEFNIDLSIGEAISALLFSQGTTMGVISYSIFDVQEVDLRLSIKTFIPFTNFFYTLFFGDVGYYERSIGQLISYQANKAAYLNGGGLGSSIVSESYLIFGQNISILFAFAVGYLLTIIEKKKYYKSIYTYVWIASVFTLPMLPRSGISNYTIDMIILVLFYFLYRISFKKSRIKL